MRRVTRLASGHPRMVGQNSSGSTTSFRVFASTCRRWETPACSGSGAGIRRSSRTRRSRTRWSGWATWELCSRLSRAPRRTLETPTHGNHRMGIQNCCGGWARRGEPPSVRWARWRGGPSSQSFQKEPSLGYGIELAIETDEPVGDDGGWLLQLLRRVSGEVAEHERLRVALGKGVISMEVPGEGMPESLVTKEGRVGALVGMGASGFPRSFSPPAGAVRLLIVKALSPQELAFLLEHGRKELLQRFARGDDNHLSRVGRKPMG